jgi:ribose transport system permease protein
MRPVSAIEDRSENIVGEASLGRPRSWLGVVHRRVAVPGVRVLATGGLAYAMIPILFGITAIVIPGSATLTSIRAVLLLSAMLGVASIGQTLVIIVGGIDLSIPAIVGMGDVMITQLNGEHWSFWGAAAAVVAASIVIGAVNGAISRVLNTHSLIVTLATSYIVLGAILAWTHAQYTGSVPAWLVNASSLVGTTGPIPLPGAVVLWAAVAAIMIAMLYWTRFGRRIYAVGASATASRLALGRPSLTWIGVFALSGLCSGIAGILYAGFSGTADASVGDPLLFQTITAVVVGGTSLLGGRGGIGRTLAGAIIVTQLTTLLLGVGLGAPMQETLLGLLMLVLVAVYGREAHVSARV